jgi:hypothetical protein
MFLKANAKKRRFAIGAIGANPIRETEGEDQPVRLENL